MTEIKKLKQEISELNSSLDFTEDVLEKKVEKLEENMKDVDARIRDIYEYQVDPPRLCTWQTCRTRRQITQEQSTYRWNQRGER